MKFYVGQRVRMARPYHSANLNNTGFILQLFNDVDTVEGWVANCLCEWDRPVVGDICHTDQLEPITDGREVVSWKDCAWMPEHLRTPA
jgi:hypothetical protein